MRSPQFTIVLILCAGFLFGCSEALRSLDEQGPPSMAPSSMNELPEIYDDVIVYGFSLDRLDGFHRLGFSGWSSSPPRLQPGLGWAPPDALSAPRRVVHMTPTATGDRGDQFGLTLEPLNPGGPHRCLRR